MKASSLSGLCPTLMTVGSADVLADMIWEVSSGAGF
jgi:hypothetical protein